MTVMYSSCSVAFKIVFCVSSVPLLLTQQCFISTTVSSGVPCVVKHEGEKAAYVTIRLGLGFCVRSIDFVHSLSQSEGLRDESDTLRS